MYFLIKEKDSEGYIPQHTDKLPSFHLICILLNNLSWIMDKKRNFSRQEQSTSFALSILPFTHLFYSLRGLTASDSVCVCVSVHAF